MGTVDAPTRLDHGLYGCRCYGTKYSGEQSNWEMARWTLPTLTASGKAPKSGDAW